MFLLLLAILAMGCTEIDFQVQDGDDLMLESRTGGGVGIARSRTGGWSQSGTLVVGDLLKEVSLQANFPEAEYYTVQFNVEQPASNSPDVIAEVSWTVEGNTVRRRISVGNGTSISGTGAALSVKVRDATILGPTGEKYNVSIQVSKGTRPNPGQPVFLRAIPAPGSGTPYIGVIGPAASIDVPIPQDAGVISANVEIFGVAGAAVGLEQVAVSQLNPLIVGAGFKAYYPLIEVGFVPVFPSATVLRIFNLGPSTVDVTVLFGIDG